MGDTTSLTLADQLIKEICLMTEKYNAAIKENKPLNEAKQIRENVKRLVEELRRVLEHTHDN